jgi:hypothetical protein
MGKLAAQLEAVLQPGMSVPDPLKRLYAWIEDNGLYVDRPNGERIGFLYPKEDLRATWTESERHGGTIIEFLAEGNKFLHHWFGHNREEVLSRLCVFAKTGADGSMAALWLAPDGIQRIVHLGSGSGSLMVCVLAEEPVDFIRLLAIGYDELCWGSVFTEPPNSESAGDPTVVHPNAHLQAWVRRTFAVDIPKTGKDIVSHPDDMDATNSMDPFNQWVAASAA